MHEFIFVLDSRLNGDVFPVICMVNDIVKFGVKVQVDGFLKWKTFSEYLITSDDLLKYQVSNAIEVKAIISRFNRKLIFSDEYWEIFTHHKV